MNPIGLGEFTEVRDQVSFFLLRMMNRWLCAGNETTAAGFASDKPSALSTWLRSWQSREEEQDDYC